MGLLRRLARLIGYSTPLAMIPLGGGIVAEEQRAVVAPLSKLDRDILIRTVYGEAGGESELGMIAVVHAIRNRVLASGTSAASECQRPSQFNCWMRASRLMSLSPESETYRAIGRIVDRAWLSPDVTGGARHFYAPGLMSSRPDWARKPAQETLRIGGHSFWTGVR